MTPVGPDLRAGPLGPGATSPTGWLVTAAFDQRATCFLVADWWIATALHVATAESEAADRVVVFNFLEGSDPSTRDAYALAPENGGYLKLVSAEVALVRLQERPGANPPGQAWGRVALASARAPAVGEPVCNICHRLRQDRHVKSFSRGTVQSVDALRIVHDAEGGEGVSGAPLFGDDGAWLGVHLGESGPYWHASRADVIVAALAAGALPPDLRQALEATP